MFGLSGASGGAIGFALVALFLITLDRLRSTSPSKDDTQLELKILLYAFIIFGVSHAAEGITELLALITGLFKAPFGATIKSALPSIIVGGAVAAGVWVALLPRTNSKTMRAVEILTMLALGLIFGFSAIVSLDAFLKNLIGGGSWEAGSVALATFIVSGAIGLFAILTLGNASGWTMPVRPPPAAYPPPGQGGYPPPQGGGYPPPQGGGYPPPQGGGYPPQGGGGGYPPQGGGGGYPPQGGGGYPPPGGGGYPPR